MRTSCTIKLNCSERNSERCLVCVRDRKYSVMNYPAGFHKALVFHLLKKEKCISVVFGDACILHRRQAEISKITEEEGRYESRIPYG